MRHGMNGIVSLWIQMAYRNLQWTRARMRSSRLVRPHNACKLLRAMDVLLSESCRYQDPSLSPSSLSERLLPRSSGFKVGPALHARLASGANHIVSSIKSRYSMTLPLIFHFHAIAQQFRSRPRTNSARINPTPPLCSTSEFTQACDEERCCFRCVRYGSKVYGLKRRICRTLSQPLIGAILSSTSTLNSSLRT